MLAVVPVLVMMNLHPLKRKSKDSVIISTNSVYELFFSIVSHICCYLQLLSIVVHVENFNIESQPVKCCALSTVVSFFISCVYTVDVHQ